MKDVEEELIRQLAEKRIDTSGYLGPSEGNADSWKLKENEQNVRNKAREKLFTQQIEEYVIILKCTFHPILNDVIDEGRKTSLGLKLHSSTKCIETTSNRF